MKTKEQTITIKPLRLKRAKTNPFEIKFAAVFSATATSTNTVDMQNSVYSLQHIEVSDYELAAKLDSLRNAPGTICNNLHEVHTHLKGLMRK